MINILPVKVLSTVDLSAYNIKEKIAEVPTLQGKPDDRKIQPEKSTISVSKEITLRCLLIHLWLFE